MCFFLCYRQKQSKQLNKTDVNNTESYPLMGVKEGAFPQAKWNNGKKSTPSIKDESKTSVVDNMQGEVFNSVKEDEGLSLNLAIKDEKEPLTCDAIDEENAFKTMSCNGDDEKPKTILKQKSMTDESSFTGNNENQEFILTKKDEPETSSFVRKDEKKSLTLEEGDEKKMLIPTKEKLTEAPLSAKKSQQKEFSSTRKSDKRAFITLDKEEMKLLFPPNKAEKITVTPAERTETETTSFPKKDKSTALLSVEVDKNKAIIPIKNDKSNLSIPSEKEEEEPTWFEVDEELFRNRIYHQ